MKDHYGAATPKRVLTFIALLLFFGCISGCASRIAANSSQPVRCRPIEVLVRSNIESFPCSKIAVFPFAVPAPMFSAVERMTDIYSRAMVQSGLFCGVRTAPVATTDEEAIWWGRHEGFDLVMRPSVEYLMDSSGAMPTRLQTNIRILDVRSANTIWHIRQEAFSESGYDIDLYWTTISGQPAQRYQILAGELADQFSGFLKGLPQKKVTTPEKEKLFFFF